MVIFFVDLPLHSPFYGTEAFCLLFVLFQERPPLLHPFRRCQETSLQGFADMTPPVFFNRSSPFPFCDIWSLFPSPNGVILLLTLAKEKVLFLFSDFPRLLELFFVGTLFFQNNLF